MECLIYIILCYSVSNIIAHSAMFAWLHNIIIKLFGAESKIYELLNCMMCLPTWVGFFLSFVFIFMGYPDFSIMLWAGFDVKALAIFFDGVIASGTSWLIHTFQESMEDD